MSTSVPGCPRCSSPIPADAPLGLCPTCVLSGAALASDAGTRSRPALEIPPIETIRAAFPQLEILELVGSGGMGVVYHARQPQLDRHVALKILPLALGVDPAFAERFNREARFLARLSHPNIVAVHDFGQANGFCFLLMEYVDGVNLREAMRTGRFSPTEALALIPGICDALQYAHSQGVLHRDIKPENLLLDPRGRIRIVDFGVAKLVGEDPHDITLTVPGARVGTPHYMAPEQVEKPSEVDHRADIYSLGVVLYELLTGELPLGRFAAPSAKAWLDARVDAIVLRALAKERELRQQSASEVKADVERLGTVHPDPPSPPERTPSRWGNGRLLGIPILRPGTAGPAPDWTGLGIAWLGLASILLPLGWMLAFSTGGPTIAQRLTLTTGFVLGILCPAILAGVVAAERLSMGSSNPPEPRSSPPPPGGFRVAGWALLVWAFVWTGISLVSLHAPPTPSTFRRIDLGGEWMLLPACIALWTGHRGWRRLATVHGGLIIGTMIVGGLFAALLHLPGNPPFVDPPPIVEGSTLRSIGNTLAFLGSLIALWSPAVSSCFLPATPWIPLTWRRRLATGLLGLAVLLPTGTGIRTAFQAPRYESTATVELASIDPYHGWVTAVEKCSRDFPGTRLLLVAATPTSQPTADLRVPLPVTAPLQYRIISNAPTPDETLAHRRHRLPQPGGRRAPPRNARRCRQGCHPPPAETTPPTPPRGHRPNRRCPNRSRR